MERGATMKNYKVPNNSSLLWRVGVEVIAMLVLGYPMLHIYVFLQGNIDPYKRGFFCDDESIKHPNLEEEIPDSIAFVIWASVVLLIVPGIELIHVAVYEHHTPTKVSRVPWVIVELYRVFGYFTLGALCTLLTTEMAKFKVGRLRPYFLTVCGIKLTKELCLDDSGYHKFVTDYHCPGDDHDVREARKSFLSGHSSISFYAATFLIVYLHARLRRLDETNHSGNCDQKSHRTVKIVFRGLKILRPFLQFGIFALACYICLTRISDYKHHPGDVLTGIVVGVLMALILLYFLVDLVHKPRIFKLEESYDDIEGNVFSSDSGDAAAAAVNAARSTELHVRPVKDEDDDQRDLAMKPTKKRSANSRSSSDSRIPLAPAEQSPGKTLTKTINNH
jgi:phosphatidate phosphatase